MHHTQNGKREKLTNIFNDSARMSYYKKPLLQLEEVITRKKLNLEKGDEKSRYNDSSERLVN